MIEHKEPSKDDISRVAYALYLQRGCEPGMDIEDWVRAEKELTETSSTQVNTSTALTGQAN